MRRRATLLLLAGAALACRSAPAREPAPPATAPVAAPWTLAFRSEAVLVADEIVVEGPADLVDHVALRQDEETSVYATRTIAEGLLQELAARPQLGVEVRAQLDAWSLAALRKITVLQRPGIDVPVTIRATGNAFWSTADGSGERREDQLVFRGLRGR